MTSWIAMPTDDEVIYHYPSAKVAAFRFVELRDRLPGSVQGVDPERLAMAHTTPSVQPSPPDGIRWLDEFQAIGKIFEAVRNALILRRKDRGVRWWQCWWVVRVEGHSAADERTGYSERRSREIVCEIDRMIDDELDEHQMYKSRCDLDAIEQYNATSRPRVQVVEFIYEDEEDEG